MANKSKPPASDMSQSVPIKSPKDHEYGPGGQNNTGGNRLPGAPPEPNNVAANAVNPKNLSVNPKGG